MAYTGPNSTQQLALRSPDSYAFNGPKNVLPHSRVPPQLCKYQFLYKILVLYCPSYWSYWRTGSRFGFPDPESPRALFDHIKYHQNWAKVYIRAIYTLVKVVFVTYRSGYLPEFYATTCVERPQFIRIQRAQERPAKPLHTSTIMQIPLFEQNTSTVLSPLLKLLKNWFQIRIPWPRKPQGAIWPHKISLELSRVMHLGDL